MSHAASKIIIGRNFFSSREIFSNQNNFSCYIRPRNSEPAGLHPKFFQGAAQPARIGVTSGSQEFFSQPAGAGTEQFFRQPERNKPEQFAKMPCLFFRPALSQNVALGKIELLPKMMPQLTRAKWAVLPTPGRVREITENLSCKKPAEIGALASGLLKARHEDGLAGLDLVRGNSRETGRELASENGPLADVAAAGIAKIVLREHEKEQQFSGNCGKGRAAANRFHSGRRLRAACGRARIGPL